MSANDPKPTLFLRYHKVKVGGQMAAHSSAKPMNFCSQRR